VVTAPVGWGWVWGVWAGPGLVWIRCGVFATNLQEQIKSIIIITVVGEPFAGGRQSVFLRSQLLLVRWVDAWGRCRPVVCVGVIQNCFGEAGVKTLGLEGGVGKVQNMGLNLSSNTISPYLRLKR